MTENTSRTIFWKHNTEQKSNSAISNSFAMKHQVKTPTFKLSAGQPKYLSEEN